MMKLPNNWITANLPILCNIRTGKKDANHAKTNGAYRFYTCSSEYSLCDTYSFDGKCVIVPGNGDIGLVFFYDGQFEAYQRTYVIENIKILPQFLYYHFLWNWRYINSNKQYGSTVRYVRIGNFENYIINIPPLAEQQRIVAKIDALFSELDKGVEMLQTIKQQLKTYRQAVLKWAFEGKLTDAAWELTSLKNIVNEIKIGPFGTLLHKEDYIKNGIPVINPKHMKDYKISQDNTVSISKKKANELSSYLLFENDVLIARRGEMGRTAYVSEKENGWLCGTGSMIIRFPKEYLGRLYTMLLSSEQVRKYLIDNSNGTTMDNLNEKIIKNLPFPKIPESEQNKLLAEIESRLSVCDKLEQLINENLSKATALRQSILKKAFAGKLISQDPNDEPAEKLLERIKGSTNYANETNKRKSK